jgi:cell division protein FtsZ
MIELTRTHEIHSDWKVKVLGIGGAGTHAVDRLNRDGLSGVELLVANTDARALNAAYTSERISLGQALTRGLGAGGDPELGRTAALESIAAVGERLSGASLVVLMVGLGGGTGSGAAPCIAQIARAQGAHVAVFATLPFSFEGRRRREQALAALDAVRVDADWVIFF